MSLSYDLISQFAKLVKTDNNTNAESTVYGTVVVDEHGDKYVKIDGSDQLTPLTDASANVNEEERVSVLIKNHTATVTGNISSPAARTGDVENLGDQVSEIKEADILLAKQVQAQEGYIKKLQTDKAEVGELDAATARITYLETEKASIKQLNATKAEIDDLIADKVDADVVNAEFANIEGRLDATEADIDNLNADYVEIDQKLTATEASIKDLDTKKLSAESAKLMYANINFGNITEAAIKRIFSETGLIKDLVVGNSTITGELVGVIIKGDLIEGNTVKADKLVVKGSDGLYYKLNFEAGTFADGEQVPTDSLHGSVITAKSITAEQISVKDLVAFGATIGGFHIDTNSIYSGVKSSVNNTTRGIYQDTDGQFAVGDGDSYIKYYKDSNGNYILDITAKNVTIGSSKKSVETVIDDMQKEVETMKDEITTNLRIESSRGTVFKNDSVSTVLSAVIYRGSQRITDIDTLRSAMGSSAYLQWKWQRLDEETFGVISASDSRLGNNGFTFTLSPEDVNTKVTFMCELIV